MSTAEPLPKPDYRARTQGLRQALLQAQVDLREAQTTALLLIAGVDGGGKGETVQLLNAWMDPRWIRTHAFDDPTEEEVERPPFWRYWRRLPPNGEMACFLSAWYSPVLLEHVSEGRTERFERDVERIRRFEQTLTDNGTLIFKLWLHLDAEAQASRFREWEADPLQSWRVTPRDWENWRRYDDFMAAADGIIDATHTPECRWHVVDASDDRYRTVETGAALLSDLRGHIEAQGGPSRRVALETEERNATTVSLISAAAGVKKPTYRDELSKLQAKLNRLEREAHELRVPLIGVFEGRDAAGKGGAIRRVAAAFDPRRFEVVRIGPPSDEELMHHYLWRFWRRLPRAGHVTLFDRSWYGRVLAERVEELAMEFEWRRAYDEINDFEDQLVGHGAVLVKFWLEIDRKEQKRRFSERGRVPHKRWKLTEDDRRNRRLWDEYETAIAEMLERTSTDVAPWTIVPANDKRHARLTVLRTLVAALETHLGVAEVLHDGSALAGG